MKPTNVINVERHGDFGGQKIAMGIDENSLAHIMSVLTDLYSNTVRAVVREYSTNARDSHIDAGTTAPIEITLPNAMTPFFKVRDFGLGLSVDDIYKVYSQYGASTKRDRDTVNGMLGLGCKSALTYATSFTVVSTHDGVKITVIVSRSEDGSATMEVVDTVSTADKNGVEISVPVKNGDVRSFHSEAQNFFQYWDEGTVLVNGEAPARIHDSLKMVTSEIGMLSGSGDDVVVFGGVAYPVKEPGLYDGHRPYSNPFRLVAFLDAALGDDHKIVFTPSREALTYSGVTVPTLARLRKEFKDSIQATIQTDVNAQTTHFDAMTAYLSWMEKFGGAMMQGVTYKGEVIPESFSLSPLVYRSDYGRRQVEAYNYTHKQQQKVSHDALRKAVVFTNYNGVQINSTYKNKIREYKNTHGLRGSTHFICDDASSLLPWIKVHDFEDVRAIRIGGGTSGGRRGTIPMPVYDPATGYTTTAIPLDKTKTLLYVSPKQKFTPRTIVGLYKAFPNIQIFCLGENRWEKFKRENPTSSTLASWVRKEVRAARDALTKDDILILNLTRYSYRRYSGLDVTKFDDKALADYLSIVAGKKTTPAADRYNYVKTVAQTIGHYEPDLPSVTNNVLEQYPLLSDSSDTLTKKHIYLYANYIYSLRKQSS